MSNCTIAIDDHPVGVNRQNTSSIEMQAARGHLVPGYICFSSEEKTLLFEALCNVLGQDNVYYVSKEEANKNPTRYHVSVTPNGHVLKYAS